ncbi:MAG TPA: type IV secretory system conjugative DNA transfer family protein [Candidatus Acidoferrales bacterium]|nr:type IV secretory system conjugative DNA transfer family protein [Candidatus Acidoferrales bacterium]
MWRRVLPVLILSLCAAPVFAQVPQTTIEQPVPQVQAGQTTQTAQGGLSAADYRRDVAQAVGIQYHSQLEAARYNSKEIDLAKYQAEGKVFAADYARLYSKWQAVGKGVDFERDCKQQLDRMPMPAGAPGVQGKAARGDMPSADYKRDVEQAADLQFQESQLAKRVLNKEIDNATYYKSINVLAARLTPLNSKWQAAGKGNQFQRDYLQQVRVLADAQRTQAIVARNLGMLGKAGSIAIVGFLGMCLLYFLLRQKPAGRFVSDIYGTAHYAPHQLDIADEMCLANGMFFGKSSAPGLRGSPNEYSGAPVCSTPEHHTLIVARTRTGKGARVIVPTLLRYAGSVFVIDPKGENTAITARARSQMVPQQSVRILNPWNELSETFQSQDLGQSATYNPLDILDRSDPNAVAVAQTLAAAICPAPANAKDKYWQGMAANILTAVFLWLADQAEVAGERKTLGRAREIVSLTRKDFKQKFLTLMAASEAFDGAIKEMAAPFIDLADDTYSGVMSNLSENTRFLSDPQVKASTAESSFSMEELVTRKTTVYVVIPTERMDTQKTWLRLIVAAAMHAFKRPKKRRESGHRCLFLIDEFASLGHVDDLPRDIATMGGFGVDFALAVQGLDQLKDHYGEAKNTILSNCAYQWFCNLNDLDSAKYLSEVLGKKTVVTETTSDSTSSGSKSSSDSHSTSHGETGRSLLNPDEILNLGRDVAILIQPKIHRKDHPHYLRPIDYWDLPRAFENLRKKHPSLYWEPPLRYDNNPYVDPPPPTPGSGKQRAGSKENARSEPGSGRPKMTVEDAREILGVKAGASLDEIRVAYLHLMSKVHPDHGGSGYFAKELNLAKELLTGQ